MRKGSCTAVERVTTRSGTVVGSVSGTPAAVRSGTTSTDDEHPAMKSETKRTAKSPRIQRMTADFARRAPTVTLHVFLGFSRARRAKHKRTETPRHSRRAARGVYRPFLPIRSVTGTLGAVRT